MMPAAVMFSVLALVSSDAKRTVLEVSPPVSEVVLAGSLAAVRAGLHDGRFAVVVIDPLQIREAWYIELLPALDLAGVPLVVWTTLSPASATRAAMAADRMPTEVIFRNDSETHLLRAAVRAGGVPTAPAMVLHRLASRVIKLPLAIRPAVVALFGGHRIPVTVDLFVGSTGLSRSTVERRLADVGVVSVKRLLDVARAARAWSALSGGSASLKWVVKEAGYESERTLREHYHKLFHIAPRDVMRDLPMQAFLSGIIESIVDKLSSES